MKNRLVKKEYELPGFLFVFLFGAVFADIIGVAGFGISIPQTREMVFLVAIAALFLITLYLQRCRIEMIIQVIILCFGAMLSLLFKPVEEVQFIAYPLAFAIVITIIARYDITITSNKVVLFAISYVGLSLLIDFLLYSQRIPNIFKMYYAYRGYDVDSKYILTGIAYRRFIKDIFPFRSPGVVIDPLAHGIILNMILIRFFLWDKKRMIPYLLGICLVFVMTESRSSVLFGLGYLTLVDVPRFSFGGILKIFKNPLIFFLLFGYASEIFFSDTGTTHLAGVELQGFDSSVFWGMTPYWLTPKYYVESGLMFIFSGIGIFAVPLLITWFFLITQVKLNEVRKAIFVLLIMCPIHYYLFDLKTLSSALILLAKRKETV